jgi:hypothetical protein
VLSGLTQRKLIAVKYPLYNLDDEGFADLVAVICEDILGFGTIVFTKAKDGGRDAKFTGTANEIPSKAAPWSGKFIIQAKHTTKPTASCSDADFQRILKEELSKIDTLKKEGKIDYYLIFSNRKLTGLQDPQIEDLINESVDVQNMVFGIERIDLWLKTYPQISTKANLNRLLLPLQFYENDLRNLVVAFAEAKIAKSDIAAIEDEICGIPITEKNKLNKLSEEYFNGVFKKSVDDFARIGAFLQDPKNETFLTMYQNTVSDIQEEITIKRTEYCAFDEILNHLYKIVLDTGNIALKNNRRLIRVFLHYMYFHCDIGAKEVQNA